MSQTSHTIALNAKTYNEEDAIIDYFAHYIKDHESEITKEKLLNLKNSIREYLKVLKEPFDDGKGGKVYEWESKQGLGVRFRIVIDSFDKITIALLW